MTLEMTPRERLGRMLVGAAMVVPMLGVAAIAVTKHFLWVHYDTRSMSLWLVLDAAVLIVGLVLRGEQHT